MTALNNRMNKPTPPDGDDVDETVKGGIKPDSICDGFVNHAKSTVVCPILPLPFPA
jgi:hypothetical protein